MYGYLGVFPNYREIGTRERDILEQQLEPIEDYSEMTEEEIDNRVCKIFEEPNFEDIYTITQHVPLRDLYAAYRKAYPTESVKLLRTLIKDGEL
jgi:hypothetical protein